MPFANSMPPIRIACCILRWSSSNLVSLPKIFQDAFTVVWQQVFYQLDAFPIYTIVRNRILLIRYGIWRMKISWKSISFLAVDSANETNNKILFDDLKDVVSRALEQLTPVSVKSLWAAIYRCPIKKLPKRWESRQYRTGAYFCFVESDSCLLDQIFGYCWQSYRRVSQLILLWLGRIYNVNHTLKAVSAFWKTAN